MKLAYRDTSLSAADRTTDLIARMSLEEKAAQLGSYWVFQLMRQSSFSADQAKTLIGAGIGQITRVGGASNFRPEGVAGMANQIQAFLVKQTRLGIPAQIHEESCSGLMARGATCFPQAIGLAGTFNPELVQAMADRIRAQTRAIGSHQVLAPLLDVTRDPRWGRTEETFGEDPYLTASMGCAYVRGMQADGWERGVVATGKHFVGYGASEGGLNWAPSHISPRELREVYLFPFEAAVRSAGLASIMNGYHELDGVPCGCSRWLLTELLREQWGFAGLVVSDYSAIRMLHEYHGIASSPVEAAAIALSAGLDLELPNVECYGEHLLEALRRGLVEAAAFEASVRRVLEWKFRLGLFERPYAEDGRAAAEFDTRADRELARELARQSIVLLKNEGDFLPLDARPRRMAVIGPAADSIRHLLGDYSYGAHIETLLSKEHGALDLPRPEFMSQDELLPSMQSVLAALAGLAPAGTSVVHARGCDTLDPSTAGFAEALELARGADLVVLVLGDKAGLQPDCTSGEARDKAELTLPGVQAGLARAVLATGTPVVLALVAGRPYAVGDLLDGARAALLAWLPGEEGGPALAEAIFGVVNPGGRLAISMPRSAGQVPVYYGHKKSGGRSHWLGDYVDMSTKPLFPFGFGLSYTGFAYGGLRISPARAAAGDQVEISLEVENTGRRAGDEVVQLYLRDPAATVTRPVKELKGFKRLSLAPGERKTVAFRIKPGLMAFYDQAMRLVVEPGIIEVMIGSSSEDIRLTGEFGIIGETTVLGSEREYFSRSDAS